MVSWLPWSEDRVSTDPHRLPQPYLWLSASAGSREFISVLGFESVFVFSAVATEGCLFELLNVFSVGACTAADRLGPPEGTGWSAFSGNPAVQEAPVFG